MRLTHPIWLIALIGGRQVCLGAPYESGGWLDRLEWLALHNDAHVVVDAQIPDLKGEPVVEDREVDELWFGKDEDLSWNAKDNEAYNAGQVVLQSPLEEKITLDEVASDSISFDCKTKEQVIYNGQSRMVFTEVRNKAPQKVDKLIIESPDLRPWNLSIAKFWGSCPGTSPGATRIRCEYTDVHPGSVRIAQIKVQLGEYEGSAIEFPMKMTSYVNGHLKDDKEVKVHWDKREFLVYKQTDPSKFPQPRTFKVSPLVSPSDEALRLRQQFHWSDLQSTGFYLNPNEPLTVFVESSVRDGPKPRLVLGPPALVHPDYGKEHIPAQLVELPPLENGRNEIVHNFGGIIYIRYTHRASDQPPPQVFLKLGDTAQPFPLFREGSTTDAQWKSMLDVTKVPFAEHDGKRVIITGLAKHAKKYADNGQRQQELLDTYTHIINVQDRFSALGYNGRDPSDRPSPLRPMVVESVNSGVATSYNYRAAIPNRQSDQIYWAPTLRNSWMVFHELGHQRQITRTWSWRAMMEVTVNIYSLANLREFKPPGHRNAAEWDDAKQYLTKPLQEKDFDRAGFYRSLVMFEQLRVVFGDGFYHQLHRNARHTPVVDNDADKKHHFMTQAAQLVRQDLTDYFTKWGLRPEGRTISEMKKQPKPERDYTKTPVYGGH
ncbi:hypothetical protein RU639_008030 [Aspergillus parasiticus]